MNTHLSATGVEDSVLSIDDKVNFSEITTRYFNRGEQAVEGRKLWYGTIDYNL